MTITGQITEILDLQSGEGQNGTWRKQEYILETSDSKYPKKICFAVWGDKIDSFALITGEQIEADIEIESREYNGKYYTNVQAWRVQSSAAAPVNDQAPTNEMTFEQSDEEPPF